MKALFNVKDSFSWLRVFIKSGIIACCNTFYFLLLLTNLLKLMSRSWVIEIPVWEISPSVSGHKGHKPERPKTKRPQTEMATNRNGYKPERSQTGMATNRNGHKSKRPQTETATNQHGHK